MSKITLIKIDPTKKLIAAVRVRADIGPYRALIGARDLDQRQLLQTESGAALMVVAASAVHRETPGFRFKGTQSTHGIALLMGRKHNGKITVPDNVPVTAAWVRQWLQWVGE